MSLGRRKHFAVDALSEEGQAVVRAGFESGQPHREIIAALQEATQETISSGALSNWHRWQRTCQRFAELEAEHTTAVQLVRAIPDSRIVHALSNALEHYLVSKEGEFEAESAVELLGHFQAMQKLGLAHERVKIAEQAIKVERIKAVAAEKGAEANLTRADVAMGQLELAKQKAAAAAKVLEGEITKSKSTGGKVPAAALERVLNEVYGINAVVAAKAEEDAHA